VKRKRCRAESMRRNAQRGGARRSAHEKWSPQLYLRSPKVYFDALQHAWAQTAHRVSASARARVNSTNGARTDVAARAGGTATRCGLGSASEIKCRKWRVRWPSCGRRSQRAEEAHKPDPDGCKVFRGSQGGHSAP
jgi:hypothetical protein